MVNWIKQLGAGVVLLAMCLLSLGRWGHAEPMEFEFAEYNENRLAVAVASYNTAPKCWIAINNVPRAPGYFWGLPAERQQRAMDHEVGHCLGLNHPEEGDTRPQVMEESGLEHDISAPDMAAYRARWRPYQAPALMVGVD